MNKVTRKNFFQIILVVVLTILIVTFAVVLTEVSPLSSLILIIINFAMLVLLLIKTLTRLIKHILDKEKEYFEGLFLVNFILIFSFSALIIFFYTMLFIGLLLALLPFLA